MTSLSEQQTPKRFEEFGYGMALADGMGRSSEMASRLALSTLVHLIVNFGKWNLRVDDVAAEEVMERAGRFYRGVDSTLVQAGHYSSLELPTTLTAVFFAGSDVTSPRKLKSASVTLLSDLGAVPPLSPAATVNDLTMPLAKWGAPSSLSRKHSSA